MPNGSFARGSCRIPRRSWPSNHQVTGTRVVVGGRKDERAKRADTELVFLGTGAGNGVPVFYCGCEVCLEAELDPVRSLVP